ncbi:metal-dependent phosphohydrolase domain [Glaciecola pallidula DSM 14239 = ACAM 615]|jgi:HD-GYP domain-containing protein (c-di-GMP phosphodiesterase class II)|uniref:Metal-dependent phosphohydrolase domain n=2 Tax=Brumicola TaxID=3160924 RepID=K6ZFY3_9ALTE|nr:metal-dependent phosphohydrolase domain [Glaciecola pallidula DSM 14239 = ACAM 615]
MYVENVVKQKGNVRIKTKGLIKTTTILDSLKSKGILEIEVDFDKSRIVEHDLAARSANPEHYMSSANNVWSSATTASPVKESKLTSIVNAGQHQEALVDADKLYIQAKNVQKDFVATLRSGSTPNIEHLSKLSQDIIDSVFDNVDALSCLLMLKDSNEYLAEHAINCAILLTMFASSKGMSKAEIEDLTLAGLLMDIGMASLPQDLVDKSTELNETDWAMLRSHVDIGIEIVERFSDAQPIVLDVIANHHERVDGSGYPKAKTLSEISVYSQMAAIVDCYDAMISNRHHQRSVTATAALHQLESDETLDSDLVNEFINAIGLHPVGSLVQLQSQQLGIVSQRNSKQPLNPIVMIFYSMQKQLHTAVHRVDLNQSDDYILTGVRPEEFSMNLDKFFKSVFLPQ